MECVDAIRAARSGVVARRLVLIGLLILAAVLYALRRLDLGAAVWCVVDVAAWRAGAMCGGELFHRSCCFTLLAVAGR